MEINVTSQAARRRPILTFARHYAEMVIVMLAGMFVLGGAAAVLLGLAGSDVSDWSTELSLLGMAVSMTVPMVAWMRYRGHRWAPTREMAAAMIAPSFAAIALLWAGLVEGEGTLMVIEHIAMLFLMLVVMVLRLDEYTHSHHAR